MLTHLRFTVRISSANALERSVFPCLRFLFECERTLYRWGVLSAPRTRSPPSGASKSTSSFEWKAKRRREKSNCCYSVGDGNARARALATRPNRKGGSPQRKRVSVPTHSCEHDYVLSPPLRSRSPCSRTFANCPNPPISRTISLSRARAGAGESGKSTIVKQMK